MGACVGMIFLLVGFLFKLTAVPFHYVGNWIGAGHVIHLNRRARPRDSEESWDWLYSM
jgi:hypothetical protein